MRVLRNIDGAGGSGGGSGGGGTPQTWRDALPDDLKAEPMLKDIPDIPSLTKSYVHAQRLIGQKRLPQPEEGWTPEQWNDFYGKVGRPESPDKYTMPEVKLEEGIKLDDERLKSVRAKVHGLGLTDRQFKGIMELYLGSVNEAYKGESNKALNARAEAENALKQEWGEKFEPNLNLAKNVLSKFGADEQFQAFLEQSGMGNDPRFVKLLHSIGSAMLEDTMRGGASGSQLQVTDRDRALQEIERLKTDSEFMAAWNGANHPGHQGAVQQWVRLHQIAYPGKVV